MRARPETGPDAGCTAFDAVAVDFPAVEQLTASIRRLIGQLAVNGDLCGHMNDPDLTDVFSRAQQSRHKELVTLQTFLDTVADSVVVALVAYRLLETNLAQACRIER